MIRMLLIGYCYDIRSERRICEEVHFNLAYRWFCKLGLEDEVPNHSSFSKNRHGRFREADLLRFVFDFVVQQCHEQGLIKGEGFTTDASYVRADASWEPCATSIAELLANHCQSRAVNEYLDALDNDPSLTPELKRISLTDPLSRWMQKGGPARFYYCTNYLIDIDHNIILDVEATPTNRILEVESSRKMIDRVEAKLAVKPKRLIADAAYGSGPMLDWIIKQKGIEPRIPVWDKTGAKLELLSIRDFIWDAEENVYICPEGIKLKPGKSRIKNQRVTITTDQTILYRARKSDCDACDKKMRCCPSTGPRKIARSIYEESREVARNITQTAAYS